MRLLSWDARHISHACRYTIAPKTVRCTPPHFFWILGPNAYRSHVHRLQEVAASGSKSFSKDMEGKSCNDHATTSLSRASASPKPRNGRHACQDQQLNARLVTHTAVFCAQLARPPPRKQHVCWTFSKAWRPS